MLLVFVVIYLVRGDTRLNWGILLLPVGLLVQFVLQIGIGLLLAPATVLADDTIRLVRILLRMLFYGTPIIYTLSLAPGWLQQALWFNPLSGIMEMYRAGFFAEPVQVAPMVISVLMSLGFVAWGSFAFGRMERAVLKEI